MATVFTNTDAEMILTTNLQAWKKEITDLGEVLQINSMLDANDVSTIISPEFYDDITSDMLVPVVLDKHYLNHLYGSRNTFIALHNLYNN